MTNQSNSLPLSIDPSINNARGFDMELDTTEVVVTTVASFASGVDSLGTGALSRTSPSLSFVYRLFVLH